MKLWKTELRPRHAIKHVQKLKHIIMEDFEKVYSIHSLRDTQLSESFVIFCWEGMQHSNKNSTFFGTRLEMSNNSATMNGPIIRHFHFVHANKMNPCGVSWSTKVGCLLLFSGHLCTIW